MSNWIQPVCVECWNKDNPDKPITLPQEVLGPEENCAKCGKETTSGMFIRMDPALVFKPGPKKYRKRPVVIEAMQWDGTALTVGDFIDWADGKVSYHCKEPGYCDGQESSHTLRIRTYEGTMTANKEDYIIKGIQGEFYPCKPDIFEATYEDA